MWEDGQEEEQVGNEVDVRFLLNKTTTTKKKKTKNKKDAGDLNERAGLPAVISIARCNL